MDGTLAMSRQPPRVWGGMFGLLATIALVLASIGLYAVTAHGVTERTQEIGVRMALGAQAPQVVWLFMRRTLVQLAVGFGAGLSGALARGKLLQGVLVHTAPRDPVTLIVASGLWF